MMGDDDLRAFLPEPPPPAPKRREAAISDALARFDGASVAARRPRPATTPWWKSLQRPQVGLLTTAALVAAISLPFAWTTLNSGAPTADEQASREVRDDPPPPAHDVAEAPAAIPAAKSTPMLAKPTDTNALPLPPTLTAPAAKRVELVHAARSARAAKADEPEPIVVEGRIFPRATQDTPVAMSAISAAEVSADSAGSIVVTGARISAAKPAARRDWNACTLDDPSQKLSRCRKLAKQGTKDVRAQADAHLSNGLQHAWQGDLDSAIAAFDQAIAAAPDLSIAYLNRGLAYDRRGDRTRAIADLDRAVESAPRSARAYYNRALLLRKYGDPRRAEADERRAANLDSRYEAIMR